LLSGEVITPAAVANAQALLQGAWVLRHFLTTTNPSYWWVAAFLMKLAAY
jgi:hypothetical protein